MGNGNGDGDGDGDRDGNGDGDGWPQDRAPPISHRALQHSVIQKRWTRAKAGAEAEAEVGPEAKAEAHGQR
jgi:hypothetical protein